MLAEYWMGKYPVTVAQFAAFIKASKHRTTAEEKGSGWVWTGKKWKDMPGADWLHPRGKGSGVEGKADHPVTQVSWADAAAFCGWAGKAAGVAVHLPSEAQWEKAARGTDGRLYPWGDEMPDAAHCNFNRNIGDTTPAGKYSPLGDSPYGCADMAGNVWEWVNDWYDEGYYRVSPQQNPEGPATGQYRTLRGGSWVMVRAICVQPTGSSATPTPGTSSAGFGVSPRPSSELLIAELLISDAGSGAETQGFLKRGGKDPQPRPFSQRGRRGQRLKVENGNEKRMGWQK
jgi:formylglycine-generating enzyme required for sulfatase activity